MKLKYLFLFTILLIFQGCSFATYFFNKLGGNIIYPTNNINKKIKLRNGNNAIIFRQVIFKKDECNTKNAVLFHVKFHLKNTTVKENIKFSNYPIPFFVGIDGFCAKFWAYDEKTEDMHGFYKWSNQTKAQEYSQSYAMSFMKNRSIEDSIDYEIIKYENNKYDVYPDKP
jgi:hypothetical protein